MRGKLILFLTTAETRAKIWPVKFISAAVRFKAMVVLLLIRCSFLRGYK